MATFIQSEGKIPDGVAGGLFGGDNDRPDSNQAFVYLLDDRQLVARHDRPVLKNKTAGMVRVVVSLAQQALALPVALGVEPTWGKVSAIATGKIQVNENDDPALIAYARLKYDWHDAVQDSVSRVVAGLPQGSLRDLIDHEPKLGRMVREDLKKARPQLTLSNFLVRFDLDAPARDRLAFEEKVRELVKLADSIGLGDEVGPSLLTATTLADLEAVQKTLAERAADAKGTEEVRAECAAILEELDALNEITGTQDRRLVAHGRDRRRLVELRERLASRRTLAVAKGELIEQAQSLSLAPSVFTRILAATSEGELQAIRGAMAGDHEDAVAAQELRQECRNLDEALEEIDHEVDKATRAVIAESRDARRLTEIRDDLALRVKVLRLVARIEDSTLEVPAAILVAAKASPSAETLADLERAMQALNTQSLDDLDARELSRFIKSMGLPKEYYDFAFLLMKRTYLDNGRDLREAARAVLRDLGGEGVDETGWLQTLASARRTLGASDNKSLSTRKSGSGAHPYDSDDAT